MPISSIYFDINQDVTGHNKEWALMIIKIKQEAGFLGSLGKSSLNICSVALHALEIHPRCPVDLVI